jgi:hypothetical protein
MKIVGVCKAAEVGSTNPILQDLRNVLLSDILAHHGGTGILCVE